MGAFGPVDEQCVNTLRFLAIDAVEAAGSGHPGMPMGDAPMAHVLWTRFLRHNPSNPKWPARDRFVLSAGHGSMLLYSLLYLTGYKITLDDIKMFRQWASRTPGHPEHDIDLGIETTTGPLGQGFANGVGMAIAQRHLARRFNRPGFGIFNYNIFAITSDGDMMEGVSNEAASIAGHLGLGSLVYLYSDNRITIEGPTGLAFTEDVAKRFEALNWHVQKVDGNDMASIAMAIEAAKEEDRRPSLIAVRTNIGFGSPAKQDNAEAHGAPLGAEEAKRTKENLGWPKEPAFYVPEDALKEYRASVQKGGILENEWLSLVKGYEKEHPKEAEDLKRIIEGKISNEWASMLPAFASSEAPQATRSASGKVLNAIAPHAPFLIGGSADLAPSNNTYLKGMGDFQSNMGGRNIHFGVREHAMGSILNGMALTPGIVPYCGTFLVFSDYMRPAIRLAAIMRLKLVYVFTHDSIGLGEDGPTHQPVEQLASLRAIPNLTVIRPADANEVSYAWRFALEHKGGPVALILTRQNVPVIDRTRYAGAEHSLRGGYVMADAEDGIPDIILIATGSEVHLALAAHEELKGKGVRSRLVNMPSWEIFEAQGAEYKEDVLPRNSRLRIAIEAGSPMGWHRYAGGDGEVVGIERFGASAPYKTLFEKFGFTTGNIVERALGLLSKKGLSNLKA